MKYKYILNTFDIDFTPVQFCDIIEGESESDAIENLYTMGILNKKGFEFLELSEEGI